jgi:hypothetical protein
MTGGLQNELGAQFTVRIATVCTGSEHARHRYRDIIVVTWQCVLSRNEQHLLTLSVKSVAYFMLLSVSKLHGFEL